jgi:hypothetical protein
MTKRKLYKKCMKVWRTKDGRKIRVYDLPDRHLENIIKCIESQHQRSISSPPMFQGEMAEYYGQQEYDSLVEAGPAGTLAIYDDLVQEQERRKHEKITVQEKIVVGCEKDAW